MIIKKDHDVKASKIKKAQTPQQIKFDRVMANLKKSLMYRKKFPNDVMEIKTNG